MAKDKHTKSDEPLFNFTVEVGEHASSLFAQAVQSAARKLRRAQIPARLRHKLLGIQHRICTKGWRTRNGVTDDEVEEYWGDLTELIFERLPGAYKASLQQGGAFPVNCFTLRPPWLARRYDPTLVLDIRGLEKLRTSEGYSVYLSRTGLRWQDKVYRVGFSVHAAERCLGRCAEGELLPSVVSDAAGLLGIFGPPMASQSYTPWVNRLDSPVPRGIVIWTHYLPGGDGCDGLCFLSGRLTALLLDRLPTEREAYGPPMVRPHWKATR